MTDTPETKKGYDGYFPTNSVIEYHRQSFGIVNGKAAIVASPCSGQTCVAAGALHKNGQWTACLPNRVFILIEGAEGEDAIDAVSW